MRTSLVAYVLLLLWVALASDVHADGHDPAPTASQLRAHLLYDHVTRAETTSRDTSFDRDFEPGDTTAAQADPWIAFDKVQHFSFSLLITVGSQYALENKLSINRRNALPASVAASLSIGLAKEFYDWQYGPQRYFSDRDFVANVAGILVAAGFILL